MDVISFVFYSSSSGLLIFYLTVYARFSNHKSDDFRFEKLPFVSVIICAKNENENLKKFLPEVLNQKYPSFEVIVVDDNSSDGSKKTLKDEFKNYKHLKVLDFNEEKRSVGKKQVLEFGIENASGEYLVMTDADCKPSSLYWLVGMVNGFANKSELILGVGMYEKKPGWINKLIQLDTLYIVVQYFSFALSGFPYMSVGRNVAYKKSLFESLGGFKSHYDVAGGDDDIMINKMSNSTKINVVYGPSSQTISVSKTTWKGFINQKTRHISASLKYNKTNLLLLSLSYLFTTAWYASLGLMICYSDDLAIVLTIVVLKKITLYTIFRRIFAKIGVAELILLSIIMDIMSIFVQILATINSLKRNKGKW
jgi:glycosyltransferase involved in cell wall biosynthesis